MTIPNQLSGNSASSLGHMWFICARQCFKYCISRQKQENVFYYIFIIFQHFNIMKPCLSCMHCWQKSDLVLKSWLFVICIVTVPKNCSTKLFCSFNLQFTNLQHFLELTQTGNYTFQFFKRQKHTLWLCTRASGLNPTAAAYSKCCCRSPHKTSLRFSDLCTGFL